MGDGDPGQAAVDKSTEEAVVFGFLDPFLVQKACRAAIVGLCKAIDAYEAKTAKQVTFQDDQDFFSIKYQMGMGDAQFNATALAGKSTGAALEEAKNPKYRTSDGKASLGGILLAALEAQEGNVPQALGSVAKMLCDHRPLAAQIEALPYDPKSEKDYYLFAGMFVGTQPNAAVRDLGRLGAKLNIAMNPLSRLLNTVFGDMTWKQLPGYLKLNNFHKFQLLEAGYMAGEIVRKRKMRSSDQTLLQWITDGASEAAKWTLPGPGAADAIMSQYVDLTTAEG